MLTTLDFEIFPDDCEVVHVPLHNQWIYLIQKNGSSSLRLEAGRRGWPIYRNEELKTLEYIDVYLREPQSRYLSGINTFVQHLVRDDSSLDKHTCETIAIRYLFLNRHYLPQWHWIANLARFISPMCVLRLKKIDDLHKVTDIKSRAAVIPLTEVEQRRVTDLSGNIDLWLLLDQILYGRAGDNFTWLQLLDIFKHHPAHPLDLITNRLFSVADVLRQT